MRQDYLSNRTQHVMYCGVLTHDPKIVSCGVPQGSIIGPLLLFLNIKIDDTNLFLDGNNLQDMENGINSSLKNIVTWLQANKLSLNVQKDHCHVLWFSINQSLMQRIYSCCCPQSNWSTEKGKESRETVELMHIRS